MKLKAILTASLFLFTVISAPVCACGLADDCGCSASVKGAKPACHVKKDVSPSGFCCNFCVVQDPFFSGMERNASWEMGKAKPKPARGLDVAMSFDLLLFGVPASETTIFGPDDRDAKRIICKLPYPREPPVPTSLLS